MKKCKFGIILLLVLFLILVFFTRINNSENPKSHEAEEINITVEKPIISKFWILPYININNNWTQTALTDWCSGSGKANDPYVIENVTVSNPSGITYIRIENSEDYFVLNNCTVQPNLPYPETGIILNNVKNGTINECKVVVIYKGFNFDNCQNITISNCTFINVWNYAFCGIYLYNSNNNTIYNNTQFVYNPQYITPFGICLNRSNYNNISYNHITNNIIGIYLYRANYSYVAYNVLKNNSIGIFSDQCKGNIFKGNYDDSIPPPSPPVPPSVHHGNDKDETTDFNLIEFLADPITLVFVYPILLVLAIIITKDLKRLLSHR